MKRITFWMILISGLVLIMTLGVMGVKILDHDYDILTEAYVLYPAWALLVITMLIRRFTDKCPHCGKLRYPRGKYCPHCGKELP